MFEQRCMCSECESERQGKEEPTDQERITALEAENARLRAELACETARANNNHNNHQQTLAENAELRKDAESLWKALHDLSFHCEGALRTKASLFPIYKRTFHVMDGLRNKYSAAMKKAPS